MIEAPNLASRVVAAQAMIDAMPGAMSRECQDTLYRWRNGYEFPRASWRFPAANLRLLRLLRGDAERGS
jgi:hypothetical protein